MSLSLLIVVAHPDDESFGLGATLAKYTAQGVKVSLVVASRGEGSTLGTSTKYSPQELGAIREGELECAARILGLSRVKVLGYPDTEISQVNAAELQKAISDAILTSKPDVILTFHPGGITSNPDHVAITKAVTAAYETAKNQGNTAPQLYYWSILQDVADQVKERSGIRLVGVPMEAITTVIDVGGFRETQWEAIACHQSQSDPVPPVLKERLAAQGNQEFFIKWGASPPPRLLEYDLFQ